MGDEPHVPSNERGVHKSVSDMHAGACLDHNAGGYHKNSCCYRYQAKQEPRKDWQDVYANYPLKSDAAGVRARVARFRSGAAIDFLATSRYKAASGKFYPAASQYSGGLDLPEQADDWKLNGPGRVLRSRAESGAAKAKAKVVPKGENFTKAFWPYWNNAHHLISKATFAERVSGITDIETRKLVTVGLLRAMYNINHHKNVLFLPMDEEVGQLLLLPRHLTLKGSSSTVDPNPCFNHTRYNTLVDTELKSIVLDDYCAEVDRSRQGKKLCDALKVVSLSKKKLEDLSEQCFEAIVDFGKASAGAPLVDIPSL